ncbi:tigger transposable element-derived protein 4-like [Aedes aegypti]|uniref:Uncharacterized protein n=1 Tax=Aedes aegypti TaxID=7159 RepID=A0A6I8TPY1_AEDAE|nr:tigger transposable element-derived protein 4-like [Aedes aegypti]
MEKVEKRIIKVLTVAQRNTIIDEYEASGAKVTEIAKRFQVPQSTVSSILKNREKWRLRKLQNENLQVKRAKAPVDERLERALQVFISQARENSIPLSGLIIREKACQLAKKLGVPEFQGSSGWLFKFLKRHNISFKKVCGENAAVDSTMAGNWMTNVLPGFIQEYDPKDIYNADETGLFYKCLPDRTYAFKSESCHGGKYSKQRLTILCAANMDGSDKLPLLVIGKSRKPRCFKNVKSLPVKYEANSKAWMTSLLFEKWMLKFDQRMSDEDRKILMFVDNCTAHPKIFLEKLKSIKLVFFPPNATSVLQPLDLGIIKSLKHYYRYELVKERIHSMEIDQEHQDITVLDARKLVSKVWSVKVKAETIQNCFRKAGFVLEDEDDIPLAELVRREAIRNQQDLALAEDELFPVDPVVSFSDYCDVDRNVICNEMMTDDDILEFVTGGDLAHDEPEDVLSTTFNNMQSSELGLCKYRYYR